MHSRYYADFTDYARPWFEPGPPLQDWRAPAPFQQVIVPVGRVPSPESIMRHRRRRLLSPRPGSPFVHDPFMRHYFAPRWPGMGAPAMYGRGKDAALQGSMARIPPSPSPAPGDYRHMVPRYPHHAVSEAPDFGAFPDVHSRRYLRRVSKAFDIPMRELRQAEYGDDWDGDDDDEDLLGDDDFDLLGDDWDDWGADEEKKMRPFQAISKLFRKAPGSNKTVAEEALITADRLQRRAAELAPAPPHPEARSRQPAITPTQIAMGVGVGLGLLVAGFAVAKAWA